MDNCGENSGSDSDLRKPPSENVSSMLAEPFQKDLHNLEHDNSQCQALGKQFVEDDPFAYLDKNGFSSEKFKIEIRGLPKYYGLGELRKLLIQKLGLNCNKIKSPGNRSFWVYACFRSLEDRDKALNVLNNYRWKGSTFEVKVAEPTPDPLVKRRNEEKLGGDQIKKLKLESSEQQEEAIKNSATPLWNKPYSEQLKHKMEDSEALIRRLGSELLRSNKELSKWIEWQRSCNNGLPCKLLDIRSLPEFSDHYRNKCEFTIGINELTGEKTIGFRLGTYASGIVSVAPIDNLRHIPHRMLDAVKVFEKFIKKSDLDVFTPETLKGHWVQFTVRLGVSTEQIMLIVGFHPQNMNEEELGKVKGDVKEFFTTGEGLKLNITSLYFEIIKRRQHRGDIHPIELLFGNKYIEELLFGLKFKISPRSFFQINTKCSELLINSVKELSGITSDSTVLDVCCGTGTIGLSLAKYCSQVLGIEIIKEAVEDANENAAINNITNSEFFCGKADDILASVASRAKGNHTVAIVDPPRAGLHNRAITLLRKTKNIDRIVYLSCNPKSAFNNFIEFGRPQSKKMFGLPFVPVKAVPVDMFPHSPHYEMVIYFERIDIAEKKANYGVKVEQQDKSDIPKD